MSLSTTAHRGWSPPDLHKFLLLSTLFSILLTTAVSMEEEDPGKNRCYSCASDNMKENFLTRSRGPPGRVREPRLFDSMCDSDTWVVREKSAIECQGACFKWQQTLNNSGVLSYATIRGCYERMFDSAVGPTPSQSVDGAPPSAYTTECKHVQRALVCLDEYSSVEEATCWCFGDFCNKALRTASDVTMVMMISRSALTVLCTTFLSTFWESRIKP